MLENILKCKICLECKIKIKKSVQIAKRENDLADVDVSAYFILCIDGAI